MPPYTISEVNLPSFYSKTTRQPIVSQMSIENEDQNDIRIRVQGNEV